MDQILLRSSHEKSVRSQIVFYFEIHKMVSSLALYSLGDLIINNKHLKKFQFDR